MTKERRLAIKMWEQIVEALEQGKHDPRYARPIVFEIKEDFSEKHHLMWKASCWFCQYVRHDWRYGMASRVELDEHWNGCQKCPLYKESKDSLGLDYDECGCTDEKETLWIRVLEDGDVDAAKRILELLRGSK